MSQAGILSAAGSTPSIPTSFTTDVLGPAVPVANVLQIITGTPVSTNSANGIQTSGATNVVTIALTNKLSGTGSATEAVTADLITFDLGAAVAVYRFRFDVSGRDTATGDGVGYSIFASVKTDGANATLINFQWIHSSEDASLAAALMGVVVSVNDVILQATGVAGQTITYNATGEYVVI